MNVHPSLAEIPEHQLVDALLADHSCRRSFTEIHGMPRDPVALRRVDLRDAPGDFEGDVDILLFNPSEPERTVAMEVKRIKVGARSFVTSMPNKLSEIDKAKEQANCLARCGFAQVYLYLIIVVDSRSNNAGEITYRGMTPPLRAATHGAISELGLEPRIGLIVLEFVQSMDRAPLESGSSAGHLIRLAIETPQSDALTRWIEQLSRSNAV